MNLPFLFWVYLYGTLDLIKMTTIELGNKINYELHVMYIVFLSTIYKHEILVISNRVLDFIEDCFFSGIWDGIYIYDLLST